MAYRAKELFKLYTVTFMYFLLVFKIVFHVMLQLNESLNVIVWKLIVSHLVNKLTVCKTASFIVVFTNVHL